MWFSMWQCCTVGVSYQPSTLMRPGSRLAPHSCRCGGRVGEDVVREFLVQQRGIGLHGLLHVQHEGIFLIFHAQRAQGLRGGDLILRDDGGDVIAVKAHADVSSRRSATS